MIMVYLITVPDSNKYSKVLKKCSKIGVGKEK